jgi:CubicO group peptidase (beta-lactamase class C family)
MNVVSCLMRFTWVRSDCIHVSMWFLALVTGVAALDWSPVNEAVAYALEQQVFPGCVVGVADASGVLLMQAYGNFTYTQAPPISGELTPMSTTSLFDIASLTKVTATTSALAQFYERGQVRAARVV